VYVEEVSYRSKSIEGVATTTTGFIGPTRYGPVDLDPDIITSLEAFERTYGDGEKLVFGSTSVDNFMWHAARAFFVEGGKRLYVSRIFRGNAEPTETAPYPGHGSIRVGRLEFRARYPGALGNFRVRLTLRSGDNVVGRVRDPDSSDASATKVTLGTLSDRDVVWVRDAAGVFSPASLPVSSPSVTSPPLSSPPVMSPPVPADVGSLHLVERDSAVTPFPWRFIGGSGSPASRTFGELLPDPQPGQGDSVRVLTLTVELRDKNGLPIATWTDLPLDPAHQSNGLADSLFAVFGMSEEARALPLVVVADANTTGIDVVNALFRDGSPGVDLDDGNALVQGITRADDLILSGGDDGARPGTREYEGKEVEPTSPADGRSYRTGLKQLEALEDISIVAAPGVTWGYTGGYRDEANAVTGLLIAHAQNMRYRIAVLDSAQNQSITDVRKMRAKLDSKYAALYFPWVKVLDPITRRVITLPPSGFVAGIYARNDVNRAVFKAPANEVVNLALGFEMLLSKGQQEVLNPEGVNCFRFFEGRGMLLWGARTISSDPEWKYVSLRRYMAYLERSIDLGTQWAVFEPNGERLWANVRRTIEDFLLNEWQMGAMLGDKPEKAFFVKCDRGTMSQNDLDNGRLVCKIGVAVVKPAEFVIFRIGQWTADHKV
jgi:phage tail sheath protein FI